MFLIELVLASLYDHEIFATCSSTEQSYTAAFIFATAAIQQKGQRKMMEGVMLV